jgi:hypothetical protein
MFILSFSFDQTGSKRWLRLPGIACPVKYIEDMERSEFNWGTL